MTLKRAYEILNIEKNRFDYKDLQEKVREARKNIKSELLIVEAAETVLDNYLNEIIKNLK